MRRLAAVLTTLVLLSACATTADRPGGNPCLLDTFEEPDRGRMAHIDWARKAAVVVVAPATANTLNRLSSGIGDDMRSTEPRTAAGDHAFSRFYSADDKGARRNDPIEHRLTAGNRLLAQLFAPRIGLLRAWGHAGSLKLVAEKMVRLI